jgi:N utilization substance protein A
LSLAIGKKGQNVRLAAKLTGWKIDIKSEEEKRREVEAQFGALEIGGAEQPEEQTSGEGGVEASASAAQAEAETEPVTPVAESTETGDVEPASTGETAKAE